MYSHPPLQSRVIKPSAGFGVGRSPPTCTTKTTARNGRYKMYDVQTMQQALDEIEKGMSIRRAAEAYNIPKSTLGDMVSGKSSIGARSGCAILSCAEEQELCTFLVEAAKIGYPRTCQQAIAIAQEIADKKGIDSTVTKGWWQSYCARFPQLTLRSSVPLTKARHRATDPAVLDTYYDILYECLSDNEILDEPATIYNCDETGLPINPASHQVITTVGSKNTFTITDGTKGQYTVLACTCATGTAIPPFIVLNRKSLGRDFTKGEVPGTLYGLSANGWMTQELFHQWFLNHFLKYATPQRPIILIMDGHSSHYSPATIKLAAEHKVILFTLPPNTTHLTQPLDRACFAPLKNAWREIHHIFLTNNPGRRVTHNDFSALFAQAWFKSMTMANIIAGFRVTGIFPFQRMSLEPPSTSGPTLAERTGLAYIPLFTPARTKRPLDMTTNSGTPYLAKKESTPIIQAKVTMRTQTSISNILEEHIKPPSANTSHLAKPRKEASTACVVTSKENLQALDLKQKAKEEKEAKKSEKQRMREDKAKTKAAVKEQQRKLGLDIHIHDYECSLLCTYIHTTCSIPVANLIPGIMHANAFT